MKQDLQDTGSFYLWWDEFYLNHDSRGDRALALQTFHPCKESDILLTLERSTGGSTG